MPSHTSKGFANLQNGDCLPHALGLATQYLLNRKVTRDAEHISLASQLRVLLHRHINDHWLEEPGLGPAMAWSQIVTLAHNTSVSEQERAQFGEWGSDAEQQRMRWHAERDGMYCGLPELLAFVECLRLARVHTSLRVWRQVRGVLQLSTRVPEPAVEQTPSGRFVVLDLQLTGELDSANAHYKLLQAGSLRDGVPKKRKRS
uniref:OTU domain-containing protein n=1 Tax=Calcidiscus leptoporus TaxID=127549 RepID=A0A7S0JJ82_9EUKA